MRKSKKILSILTAALVMVSMTSIFSFAEEIDGVAADTQDDAVVQEEATDAATDADVVEGEDVETPAATTMGDENTIVITPTVTADSASLKWASEPDATKDDYTITVDPSNVVPADVVVGETETNVVLSGLEAYEKYTVTVTCGDKTGVVTFTAADPLALRTLSGNHAIKLVWNGTEGTEYVIEKKVNGTDGFGVIENAEITFKDGEASFIDKDLKRFNNTSTKVNQYYSYDYRVSVKDVPASMSKVVTDTPVRSAYDRVQTKTNKTLTSHDGKNMKITFPKGTVLQCYGFNGGKFEFYYNPVTKTFADARVDKADPNFNEFNTYRKNNGKNDGYYYFTIARINTKGHAFGYTKSFNYSTEEAEFYINNVSATAKSSKTSKLIWVSEYCQHLYVFYKGSDGQWKADRKGWNWEISTGKASTPTPNGVTKQIQRKVKKRHSIPWWNPYQTWNSLHGVKRDWAKRLGTPQSSGCIRNSNANAKIIYDNCPKGTRLRIY